MTTKNAEEFFKNKKHIHGVLQPLVQHYSKETTLAVYCLNPLSAINAAPERVCDILRSRGYTRLYIMYLFSRIGEFEDISGLPVDELINTRCNQLIDEITPDVSKIFFSYGDISNQRFTKMVMRRVLEVQKRILDLKPDTKFHYFGELSGSGYPKKLDALDADDVEVLL